MLTNVRISNLNSESVNIGLAYLNGRAGYTIRDIKGLGPMGATIAHTDHPIVPGGVFHSATLNTRNVVIRAGFNPDHMAGKTVTDLRREIQRVAMPGSFVTVRLWTDGVYDRYVSGWVETVEPVIFSEDPEVQISILCTDPIMYDTKVQGAESRTQGTHYFEYRGDIPSGISVDVHVLLDTFSNFSFEINGAKIYVDHDFTAGEIIRVNTTPGKKEVTQRTGSGALLRNIIGRATITKDWPSLTYGTNKILVQGNVASGYNWDLTYQNLYGGY